MKLPTFTRQHIRFILAIFFGVLTGFGIIASTFALFSWQNYQRVFVSAEPSSEVSPTPTPTPDPLAPFGVLLLGFGGPGHEGGYLTDTMMVAYVQPRQESVTLISLPRDLWVTLPTSSEDTQSFKVNAAYAIGRDDRRYPNKIERYRGEAGGGALAKDVVSQVTGLPIQYFVAISFDGFMKAIDTVGGVTVRVLSTFEDPLYPLPDKKTDLCGISEEELVARMATLSGSKLEESFPCRYETLRFEAGPQTMDGLTALKYVRSRHSPQSGGDAARSARQKAVIAALKDQIFRVQFVSKIIPFISSVTRDMQLDIDLATLQKWVGQAAEYQSYEIKTLEISEKNILEPSMSSDRQYILVPRAGNENWESIHQYIQEQLTASVSGQTAL